jgi:hypothetical protein
MLMKDMRIKFMYILFQNTHKIINSNYAIIITI